MVFSQYKETYEVLRDYPKLEGEIIKDYAKMAIRNLLHANSCVHSRRLIAEFPEDRIKCFLQSDVEFGSDPIVSIRVGISSIVSQIS